MNRGNVGAPFQYSDSYIQFLAFVKTGSKIPYRMVQGAVCGLSEYVMISAIRIPLLQVYCLLVSNIWCHVSQRVSKIKSYPDIIIDSSLSLSFLISNSIATRFLVYKR
jgi:hypothetical protein